VIDQEAQIAPIFIIEVDVPEKLGQEMDHEVILEN